MVLVGKYHAAILVATYSRGEEKLKYICIIDRDAFSQNHLSSLICQCTIYFNLTMVSSTLVH